MELLIHDLSYFNTKYKSLVILDSSKNINEYDEVQNRIKTDVEMLINYYNIKISITIENLNNTKNKPIRDYDKVYLTKECCIHNNKIFIYQCYSTDYNINIINNNNYYAYRPNIVLQYINLMVSISANNLLVKYSDSNKLLIAKARYKNIPKSIEEIFKKESEYLYNFGKSIEVHKEDAELIQKILQN